MENASKAIIMAGGILITLVIVSLLVMLFGQIGNIYSQEDNFKEVEQLEEYNRKFAAYTNIKSLYGSELLSLANLANDYNKKLLDTVGGEGHEGDSYYNAKKIEIKAHIGLIMVGELTNKQGEIVKNKYGKIVKKYTGTQLEGGVLKPNIDMCAFTKDLKTITINGDEWDLTGFKSTPFKVEGEIEYNSDNTGMIKRITFVQTI